MKDQAGGPGVHVIRLRGPWDFEVLEGASAGHAGRVTMPADWAASLGADFIGRVRYTRRFNCPTNLGPREHVWLVLEAVDPASTLALNGHSLGVTSAPATSTRVEITPCLAPQNMLLVEITMSESAHGDAALRGPRAGLAGGLIGEVRLEISG